jgi:hypothetical protein
MATKSGNLNHITRERAKTIMEDQSDRLARLAGDILAELSPKYDAALARGDKIQAVHLLGLIQQTQMAQANSTVEALRACLQSVAAELAENGIKMEIVID